MKRILVIILSSVLLGDMAFGQDEETVLYCLEDRASVSLLHIMNLEKPSLQGIRYGLTINCAVIAQRPEDR